MPTALAYFAVAAATAWFCHRLVQRLSLRAAIVLILLPLCFTGKALLTGRVYAPIDLPLMSDPLRAFANDYGVKGGHNGMLSDVYCLNIPWKAAVRFAYGHGEWPLWNPFNFCGDILAAAAQPTPYEPFFLTSLLLPLPNSLTYLAAITLFLGGLLMFVFLRDLDCGEESSLIGAAAWMFSSFLVFWLEWVITPSTIWFPLVLTGVRRVIRRQSAGAVALLVAAFVMMLLNGHPETALHAAALAAVWAAAELSARRGRGFLRAAVEGGAAGVLALLITAMYMLPMVEAIGQSYEHAYRAQVFASQKKSIRLPDALQHLEFQFLPFRYGDPSVVFPKEAPPGFPNNAYCGTVVLPLALLGIWRSRKRTRWLALLFILTGLLIGSSFAPFADWLGRLPLFDIAINTRLIFAVSFGLAILAAFGAEVVFAEGLTKELAITSAVTLVLLAALCAIEWQPMHAWGLSDGFIRARAAMFLLPLALLSVLPLALKPRAVAAALLFLLLAQRTAEASDFYPTLPARIFYPRIPLLDRLPKTDVPYRIVGQGLIFYPNMSTIYGVEDVRGYQAMTFLPLRVTYPFWSEPQVIWFNRVDDLTRPFLSMMNVRYALVHGGLPVPEGWRKIGESAGTQLFENMHVLPRAFVPQTIRVNAPWSVRGSELWAQSDFAERAWIDIDGEQPQVAANGAGRVSITKRGMRAFDLRASMQTPSWVVVTESAWKGWRVIIDGKSAKLHSANHAFVAFFVPAGVHEIRLFYWPQSFVAGRAISLTTLAGLALFMVLRHRSANRGTVPRSDRSR